MKDKIEVLHLLHRNMWCDELLGGDFKFVVDRILTPRERQLVEMKVQGLPEKEIMQLLCIKFITYGRIIYKIKRKFRHQMETRVDNLRPEFIVRNRRRLWQNG